MNLNDKNRMINAYNKHMMKLEMEDLTERLRNRLMVDFADIVEETFPSKKGFMKRLMGE